MRAKYYLAVVVLCAVPMFGQTGNELIKQCGEEKETFTIGYCAGLVNGVAQMQVLIDCCTKIPDGVTLGQSIRVVQKYLEDHPKDLNRPDWLLVQAAFSDAWPRYPESQKPAKKGSAH